MSELISPNRERDLAKAVAMMAVADAIYQINPNRVAHRFEDDAELNALPDDAWRASIDRITALARAARSTIDIPDSSAPTSSQAQQAPASALSDALVELAEQYGIPAVAKAASRCLTTYAALKAEGSDA